MQVPLSLWDYSLWLAVLSIILLITSELMSPFYGKIHLYIKRKRLRKVTLVIATLFFITVMIRTYEIIINMQI